jgi:glycosyltransferase involved in cell wall biosynthesis
VKPNLLVLASTFPVHPNDGTPAFVLDLAKREAMRFNVTVLTPRVPGSAGREVVEGVSVVRYPYFFKRYEDLADGAILDNLKARRSRWLQVAPLLVGLALAIRKQVKLLRPEAIHAHWVIPQGLIAALVAPKVPPIATTHGGDIYALNQKPLLALKKWVFAKSARITTVNRQMRDRLVALGTPSEKIAVLPMGVDTQAVSKIVKDVATIEGQLLVVGRLVEKKGIGYLFEAIRGSSLQSRLAVKVIGDGPLRAELEGQADGLPVEFLGQRGRDEVLRAIAESQLMAIPSVTADSGDQEGLPVTLLEGAAGAIAVVASRLPGIDEVIEHEVSGLLVEQRDAVGLASAIERLLDDHELRNRVASGIAKAAKRYDLSVIGEAYCEQIDLAIREAREK